MTRKLCLTLIGILLLVVPALGAPASAQEVVLDSEWRQEERDLTFTRVAEGFLAKSSRESDLGNDELDISFILDDGTLRMDYVSKEPGNETVLVMKYTVLSLVEFRDGDGNGRYGFGDEVVQRIHLEDMDHSHSAEPFLSDGRVATATYTFPDDEDNDTGPLGDPRPGLLPGHLALRFYIVPTTQSFGGSQVTPLEVKFDVEIDRFPFEGEADDTVLALETRFEANRPIGNAEWTDDALQVPDGYFRGFLSWTDHAEVDDERRPVGVTTQSFVSNGEDEDSSSRTVAFTYPQGDKIVHDPEMGVVRYQAAFVDVVERLVRGDWLLYGLGLVVAVLAVGVPAGIRLRER